MNEIILKISRDFDYFYEDIVFTNDNNYNTDDRQN